MNEFYQKLIKRLQDEKCIQANGWLAIWPAWLTWEDVEAMVEAGLMTCTVTGLATIKVITNN